MLNPFRPEKEEDVQYLQTLQSDIHQTFIDRSSLAWRPSGCTEDELYSGQFWTGKARELGLVDGLGNMHDMLSDRFGEEL